MIVLDCSLSTIQCAADGDSIETIIEASPSLYDDAGRPVATSIRTTSTVHIMVEALASCENTVVHVFPDVLEVLESTPMRIEVLAVDVDGLAIKYTRPEIEAWWADDLGRPERLGYSRNSGHARAHERTPARRASMHTRTHACTGTNRFVFEVPERLVMAGAHDMVIRIKNGWNRTMSGQGDCELLRRRVAVAKDTTQRIIGFSIAGILLLMFGATALLVFRNRHRAKQFLISFMSFEGLVGFELCLEIWERCHPRSSMLSAHCSAKRCARGRQSRKLTLPRSMRYCRGRFFPFSNSTAK
jgi:hypothetical protein